MRAKARKPAGPTPIPWTTSRSGAAKRLILAGAGSRQVAIAHVYAVDRGPVSTANAALIVRAVNHHDGLRRLAGALLALLMDECAPAFVAAHRAELVAAEELLSQARGGEP